MVCAGFVNSEAGQYGSQNAGESPGKEQEAIIGPEIFHAKKIGCDKWKQRKEGAVAKTGHHCTQGKECGRDVMDEEDQVHGLQEKNAQKNAEATIEV